MAHRGQLTFVSALVALHLLGLCSVELSAEGRHLDHFVFATSAVHHMNNAKTLANDERASEQALDFFGGGVGGHIKIFGAQPQNQIAHSATHDVGFKTSLLQRLHDFGSTPVHMARVDAVHMDAGFNPLAQRLSRGFAFACEQTGDEFFDHANNSRMGQPRS